MHGEIIMKSAQEKQSITVVPFKVAKESNPLQQLNWANLNHQKIMKIESSHTLAIWSRFSTEILAITLRSLMKKSSTLPAA